MKKTVRMISLGLAVCLLATCLCGCDTVESLFDRRTDEEKIRDRLDDFVMALNSGDADAALECLDSRSRNMYNAVFNIGQSIVGAFIGFDINVKDVFALAIGLNGGDVFSMEIRELNITSGTTATVTLAATAQVAGQSESEVLRLDMVKEKNDWYISIQVDWSSLY